MLSGLTLANVAGVPLGTLLGQRLGWRATFWTMATLGLLAAAGKPVSGLRIFHEEAVGPLKVIGGRRHWV